MVFISPPPPKASINPVFNTCAAGTNIVRMFDPMRYAAQAAKFRYFGPCKRFDHHIEENREPVLSTDRGIIYAGKTLSGCIVEVFGDSRVIDVGTWEIASLQVKRDLELLDLRGSGAMTAGTVAAICKDSNHRYSQQWSQYFYDNHFLYRNVDGIVFENAHNNEVAYAFYERCEADFSVNKVYALNSRSLRAQIQQIALKFGLIVSPY